MILDDEKDLKLKNEEENKYYVEEDEIKTVFGGSKTMEVLKVEDEEEIPQEKEDYQVKSQLIEEELNGLSPINLSSEMRKSFLEYAMSVIVSRALPDARDGLKPVHRRIIFAMSSLGMTHSTPHKKSARIVGETMAKYHPHGDSSIYDAMVRMAQEFSMRYPLIDGHGNFGSIDGDGAAAMRYTEARMSKITSLLVEGLKKNTVDFQDNYDGSEKEPVVLPARFPNLLVTGTTGIAVGMATSIPPHNLTEIVNAVIYLARNESATSEDLMQFVHGPDFPTGGIIIGRKNFIKAYLTGKGSVTLRSKTHIEELKNGKTRIIVTEIPYMVNKARLVEKIAMLAKDKIVEGITDLRDETSRKGIRVVIELKRGVVPEVMQNKLFKLTSLQTNFTMNILALVNREPRILPLVDALSVYLKHQVEVYTRKTKYDLSRTVAKAHILEGLKIAVTNIDEVISIIRNSKNDEEAKSRLKDKYKLSDNQTKAIIDMRLGRLTGLAIEKMNQELIELNSVILELKNILENRSVLMSKIIEELEEVREKFGDDRNTEIIEGEGSIDDEDLIPQKDIAITMSSRGYVKRIPLEEYQVQRRGGVGSKTMNTYEDDNVEKILTTTTHTDLLVFTSLGKVYRLRAHQIPELSKNAKGIPFINIINIEKGEKVVSLLTTDTYDENEYLFTVTKNGIIKKTKISEYSRINRNGKKALGLKPNDELLTSFIGTDEDEIIIGSSKGKVVRFDAYSLRAMGRTASGVKGIDLSGDAKNKVMGAITSSENKYILSISEKGFGKKTAVAEYRKTKRGAKGVKSIDTVKGGNLKFVGVVTGEEDILIITKMGITIRTSLEEVATSGRSAKGVKIITLKPKNAIKSVALINTAKIEKAVEDAILKTQEITLSNIKESVMKEDETENIEKSIIEKEC